MKRLTVAAAAAMLALPASAVAAPRSGVVLSVDAGHHKIQVVDGKHLAHAYRYRGSLPKLHPGSPISFARRGHTISHVRAAHGPSRSVSFYGRVVRSSAHGLVLALSDGGTVSFSAKQVAHAHKRLIGHWHRWRSIRAGALHISTGGVTLDINGLAPGTIVLITERVAPDGHTTITVTLPAGSLAPGGGQQSGGQHPAGGQPNGGDGSQASGDMVGTITQISPTADGLTISAGGRSVTFACDPAQDLADGFAVGDVVDVTYDTSNGSLVAGDVEYVEQDASGTVTAVSGASITITDSDTGQPLTIVADPAEGMFDGVSVNDAVVVTYHQSAGQLIADVVDDGTAGN
jgi:hypothetical protein